MSLPSIHVSLLELILNSENANNKATNINNKFKVKKILDQ
jgi:hypothetical protein